MNFRSDLSPKITNFLFSPEYIGCIHDLAKGFKEKQLEFQHGAILSLAYSFAPKANEIQNMNEFKETVDMILDQLDPDTNQHQHSLLVSASCLALGELGRNGPLPLPQEGTRSKQSLFKWLLQMIKSTKISIKIRERSVFFEILKQYF